MNLYINRRGNYTVAFRCFKEKDDSLFLEGVTCFNNCFISELEERFRREVSVCYKYELELEVLDAEYDFTSSNYR